MHCYLTKLRRDGARMPDGDPEKQPRLVVMSLDRHDGFRRAKATSYAGGITVGELWEPTFIGVGEWEFYLQGFERLPERSVVQEWVLKPHTG